jgi:hypothetical protein
MIMDELKYWSMLIQLNEEQRLIFDDIMYRKQVYHNIPIHIFLIKGVGIGKNFILKLIIQGLLRVYYKYLPLNLTKIKALLMASIGKIAYNIDGQTIHSTLNIHVQQTLTTMSKL